MQPSNAKRSKTGFASRKSAEVIAQELGFNANRLYAWKKTFAPAGAGGKAAAG